MSSTLVISQQVKQTFLDAYEDSASNLQHACSSSGLSLEQYYILASNDSVFRGEVDTLNKKAIDFLNSKLITTSSSVEDIRSTTNKLENKKLFDMLAEDELKAERNRLERQKPIKRSKG